MSRKEKTLKEEVLDTINKYNLIESGDKIVLGVSGGPDSISMLNILYELKEKLNFSIIVSHINHGLRKNASRDENFVRQFCENKNIEFHVLHADINKEAKKEKKGLEETGRKIRYEFFNEVLLETSANKIAIAHNKNDKAETIIMNILRGCGVNGLKGIEAKNDIYIRPLIEIDRSKIEKYCQENNLNPVIDETNYENDYTRNKIRNIIIPYIKNQFNPNIIENLNRLSDIAKEETEYIRLNTIQIYKKIAIEENILEKKVYSEEKMPTIILDLKEFNKQLGIIKKNIILYSIERLFGTVKGIEKVHIEDIIKLCSNNIGNKYLTPNKFIKIVIKNKKIYIIRLS
ncbi:MAG: tRNA lysidine(34) synthetase TilS [Candidatus Scatovivens sp.]